MNDRNDKLKRVNGMGPMKYNKYCRYENVTNAIKHSRFTIGIVIGIALMFGLIILISNQVLILILPLIGGFLAGIISSNESIAITDTNNEQQELNAGGAAGIIFGFIICFVGTFIFDWNAWNDLIFLGISFFGEKATFYVYLFFIFNLIYSYFYWKTAILLNFIRVLLTITIFSTLNLVFYAAFVLFLSNTKIVTTTCGFLGSSGGKISGVSLDFLHNMHCKVIGDNFLKRVLDVLNTKKLTGFIIVLVIIVVIASIIFPFYIEKTKNDVVLPLEVKNMKMNGILFKHDIHGLLRTVESNIRLDVRTAELNITLDVYNPNNRTIKLDKIDYRLYEIIPEVHHANTLFERFDFERYDIFLNKKPNVLTRRIVDSEFTYKTMLLPPHSVTSISASPKLSVAQFRALANDADKFYTKNFLEGSNLIVKRFHRSMRDARECPIKLVAIGELYSNAHNMGSFECNTYTSVGEIIPEYVEIKQEYIQERINAESRVAERAKHPCIITQKDWDSCSRSNCDYISLDRYSQGRYRIDIGVHDGGYSRYFHDLSKMKNPDHYGKEFHFDNGIKEYIHLWTINYTVYCDEDDIIIEDYLRQNYGVPANITIIRK